LKPSNKTDDNLMFEQMFVQNGFSCESFFAIVTFVRTLQGKTKHLITL